MLPENHMARLRLQNMIVPQNIPAPITIHNITNISNISHDDVSSPMSSCESSPRSIDYLNPKNELILSYLNTIKGEIQKIPDFPLNIVQNIDLIYDEINSYIK